ncbi:GDP-L-fucose synthase [Desulfovibrio sp. OttesenSCG-928-M14]|nr:GDP-L-fucose synthase [Desulfovibrio sp. OttesenSCG-928-M14]
MQRNDLIYVAGHRGLVGSAIVRALNKAGYERLLLRTSAEMDLRNQALVKDFFAREKPDRVFLAAAKVGGIHANDSYPADFMFDNLQIQCNVIDAAYKSGCKKLLFLGSSCIYPRLCPQPMKEGYLLSGPLEPTNEAYALAKISGIRMCQAYRSQYGFEAISAMPTNLYGPGDNFHPENSHVLPALMLRFHQAKVADAPSVTIWGTGTARREFLHVDDLAAALLFLMEHYSEHEHINVGSGRDRTIMEWARIMARVVGYEGDILTDPSKPDGMPQKLLDSSRLTALGWTPRIEIEQGLADTYAWFLKQDVLRDK